MLLLFSLQLSLQLLIRVRDSGLGLAVLFNGSIFLFNLKPKLGHHSLFLSFKLFKGRVEIVDLLLKQKLFLVGSNFVKDILLQFSFLGQSSVQVSLKLSHLIFSYLLDLHLLSIEFIF